MDNNQLMLCEATRTHNAEWETYLMWAADSFQLSLGGLATRSLLENKKLTQLIPTSTSAAAQHDLALLESFEEYEYPNEIGPCIYDIHGGCLAENEWFVQRLDSAR
ncbi:hypothetical protein EFZ10_14545 [Tatumella sp. TA1]|uniref:hypothetical protein n=1 Tax=Rosenbergiella collisarenosi TaxID=1544695 RepID=UPI0008F8D0D0|nr:hypothetical protein [Rosenbergiella collisarenosi]MBT0721911.1 hypothetical protein [Rosenbergiella collisarenosi]QGX92732.1 hypothetical protein EFZ10_14545 [Tatumella sp. TA1]